MPKKQIPARYVNGKLVPEWSKEIVELRQQRDDALNACEEARNLLQSYAADDDDAANEIKAVLKTLNTVLES